MYTAASFFAGIGGICLGVNNAGAKVIYANELDSYACKTYRANFGSDYLFEGDIRKVSVEDVPNVDIVVGGFPCQSFSIAGAQSGLNSTNGTLFFEIARMIEGKRPEAFLLENVENLRVHDNGNTLTVILNVLRDIGYTVFEDVLNTTSHGNIPHNRARIFIVGFRDERKAENFTYPMEQALTDDFFGFIDTSVKVDDKYYYLDNQFEVDTWGKEVQRGKMYQFRRGTLRHMKTPVCPTLVASMAKGSSAPVFRDDFGIRYITETEALKLQGFPSDFVFGDIPLANKYKQAGNSVSVPVVTAVMSQILYALEQ